MADQIPQSTGIIPSFWVDEVEPLRSFYIEKLGFEPSLGMVGKDGKLLSLQGRCFEAIGKFQNARTAYEESLTYPGQKRDVYVWLAYLLRHQTDKVIQEKGPADPKQPKQY